MFGKINIFYKNYVLVLTGICLFFSCNTGLNQDDFAQDNYSVSFSAEAFCGDPVETRANTSTTNLTTTYYGGINFHIYLKGKDKNNVEKFGLSSYIIPSGFSGSLIPADEQPKLNWFARNTDHNFWSWTVPWNNEDEPTTEEMTVEFRNTYIWDTTNSSANTWKAESWENGSILEKCIGAVNGPFKYVVNGQYVPLQFRHLVSKVFLGNFLIVDNATSTTISNLKGNITFYGLPSECTFTPVRSSESGTPLRPIISIPENWNYPKDQSVTYAITNVYKPYYTDSGSSTYYYDCWYFPPEIDFSKISFKIDIYEYINGEWVPSPTYNGSFFGDFSNVTFSRSTNGSSYDDYPNNGSDKTVLHAGEYMQLVMNLSIKGNPAIKGAISDWNVQNRTANQHVHDGIYSLPEANQMSSTMNSKNQDLIDEYFEWYGSGQRTSENENDPNYEDDLGIFKLYDDIGYNGTGTNSSGSEAKMSSFYVADGYILDGMGHIINMTSSSPSIGHMRDVYLRYYTSSKDNATGIVTYTEYIVYIRPDGTVCLVDPETWVETETDYNVNNATRNPFTINLQTGKIT